MIISGGFLSLQSQVYRSQPDLVSAVYDTTSSTLAVDYSYGQYPAQNDVSQNYYGYPSEYPADSTWITPEQRKMKQLLNSNGIAHILFVEFKPVALSQYKCLFLTSHFGLCVSFSSSSSCYPREVHNASLLCSFWTRWSSAPGFAQSAFSWAACPC